ncbi:XrtA-associated tyrosine autokinase [Diaphorobacter sp.]|uniref:XrtA-associated tyrosine autokinase n=1 Tax=Diaphorobacter sp. TaxID=1934310 RepID=UPI003D0EA21E
MTSSIEKAAQRFEQLRKAGAVMPGEIAPAQHLNDAWPASQAGSKARSFQGAQEFQEVLKADYTDQSHATQENSSKTVSIDLNALAAKGFVIPNAVSSSITEQFRVIKRPLLDNAAARVDSPVGNRNLIMITSAMPGEGKSFTAINLAMSMAMEMNHTVLLVDADVTHPSVMTELGLSQAPGLMDLLVDDALDLPDVLLRTNVEKLTLLPAGRPHPRATELLASVGMASLLDEMGKRYSDRIIIFDSPPLLLTTEARVLASHMGQVVIVVQAEKTPQAQVQSALETIEMCPIKHLILNQVRSSFLGGYGYGYGYGYGRLTETRMRAPAAM